MTITLMTDQPDRQATLAIQPPNDPTSQERAIDALLNVALKRAEEDPLAMFQEGWMKVELLRGLMKAGYTLREGSTTDGRDWLLSFSEDKTLAGRKTNRLKGHRGDVRIEDPRLRIELKVVPEFGSKEAFHKRDPSQGDHKDFTVDVDRVVRLESDAAVLVIHKDAYENAREREPWIPRRGRHPKILLGALFPRPEYVEAGILQTFLTNYNGADFLVRVGKVSIGFKAESRVRLALAVLRKDHTLWPNFCTRIDSDPKAFAPTSEFIIEF